MSESPNRNRNESNTPEREQQHSLTQIISEDMSESPNRNRNENNTPEREEQRRSLVQTISDAADSTRSFISNALGLRQERDNMSTPTHRRIDDYPNVHTPRNPLSPATVASSLATPRSILSPRSPFSRRSQRSHANTPRKSNTSTPRRRITTNPENLAENPDNDLLKEYYEG
ncbi:hypothetical protein C1645_342317 [Glomus cerebriforme]|uniref:Uncharacterized protein n=1 Tax=Glomus cerebriforme TaxID=658196 RepID=A0A397STN5_9GLOM|nr:hypothetical protein C1645_342317 [Glomus cerebriforme]